MPCMVKPSVIWILRGCGVGLSLENKNKWGIMWLKQAESKSQEWDLLGKTKIAVERDALPAMQIAWTMMSCSLVEERLIVNPGD